MKVTIKKGIRIFVVSLFAGILGLSSFHNINMMPIIHAEEGASAVSAPSGEYVVKLTNKDGDVVDYVNIPEPITMKVTNKDGTEIDESKYSITWTRETRNNDEFLADGKVLAMTSTSMSNAEDGMPIKVTLRDKTQSSNDIIVMAPENYAYDSGRTVLIVNNEPVYPGSTVNGVSLSSDGATVSLNNAHIENTTPFIWTRSSIAIQTHNPNLTFNINGNNTISSLDNDGVTLEMFGSKTENEKMYVNINGSGTLDVNLTSDKDRANTPFGIYGVLKLHPQIYTTISGGPVLNLKADSKNPQTYSGAGLYISASKEFRLLDGTINADTDGFNSIDINTNQELESVFYVGSKGILNAINRCTVEPPENPDIDGTSRITAVYFDGKLVEIDGGHMDLQMKNQNSSTSNGFFASHSNTTIKNKSVVKSSLDYVEGDGNLLEQISAMVSLGFVIDDSTLDLKVNTMGDNKQTAAWGLTFAETVDILNNSNVNIDMNNGVYRGIEFGGADVSPAQAKGIVTVKDSSLSINGNTSINLDNPFWVAGIDAVKFNVDIAEGDNTHKVEIHTNADNKRSTAIFLQKSEFEKMEYNPFYVPQLLTLNGVAGISLPDNGRVNVLSYQEDDESTDYINAEVIYGEDISVPAKDIVISKNDYVFQEIKDENHKLSITGLIDRNAHLQITSELHKDCFICEKMKLLTNYSFLGDISLTNAAVPYKGEIGITFDVDTQYNGKKLTLLHCVDHKAELLEAVVQDGKVSFPVTSLSPFALFDASENPVVMKFHSILATSGENGTISEVGDNKVFDGETRTFTFTPNTGYQVDKVLVDGKEVKATNNSYAFENVTSNHTIHVEFVKSSIHTGVASQNNTYAGLLIAFGSLFVACMYLKKRKA